VGADKLVQVLLWAGERLAGEFGPPSHAPTGVGAGDGDAGVCFLNRRRACSMGMTLALRNHR
jgi:hypothetical protein